MNGPYRTPSPTIFDLIEELEAAGRTRSAACTELNYMIRDDAVTLLDFHQPRQSPEWLVQLATTLIDAVRMNSQSVPYLSVDYFKKVFVDRAQFEAAAGIQQPVLISATSNEGEKMNTPATRIRGHAAAEAIKACFPQGVPAMVDLPNGQLCTQVAAWLAANYPAVAKMHDRTILRAAGRAK
jgi:hypothetical protein